MAINTKKILTWVLIGIPSAMLTMSAIMKFSGAAEVVEGLSKAGFGSLITVLGVVELISTLLFVYPATRKIGFALLCSYLGGAAATEIAGGQSPVALVLLTVLWVASYVDNKTNFFPAA